LTAGELRQRLAEAPDDAVVLVGTYNGQDVDLRLPVDVSAEQDAEGSVRVVITGGEPRSGYGTYQRRACRHGQLSCDSRSNSSRGGKGCIRRRTRFGFTHLMHANSNNNASNRSAAICHVDMRTSGKPRTFGISGNPAASRI
jgi:hypothetical protein